MDKKIIIKKSYFTKEKPKKETKHQRTYKNVIKGVVTNVKHQVCYSRIIEIVNEWEDVEVVQK